MTTQKKTVSEKQLQALVRKVQRLVQTDEARCADQKLVTYWKIGEVIADAKLEQEAGYHNSVLRDVSLATGVALRTLQRSLVFHETYKKPPTGDSLTWSHYRVLLRLPSKKERAFYSKLAREKNWTSKELERAITSDVYRGGTVEEPRLVRPDDPSYLYQAEVAQIVDGDTLQLFIDLGFHSFSKQRVRLAGVDTPEIRTKEGRAARNFVADQLFGARTLVVKTVKSDLHGRFVVHLFYAPVVLSIGECFSTGSYLNEVLVQAGHAEVVG